MPLKFVKSLNYAIEGILHAAKTQRHVRIHFLVIIILLIVCFLLGVQKNDFIIVSLIAALVIISEIFNSAVETLVDMVSPRKNEMARVTKDMAAGAVLISAGTAIIAAFYILLPYLESFCMNGFKIIKHQNGDIALSAMMIVTLSVIMIKSYFGKGTPLRGGMPSGHSALSFSAIVSALYSLDSIIAVSIIIFIGLVISLSRIVQKIHTPLEVFAGMLTGATITWGMFMVFAV
ncbi:MAG TPA: diacylglycerol kinase [Spirochaetota bacterium]|nr:diacylglycerol kinase [Spirochaetota bacterium]HOR43484.1 diacylglycerol kinase [Spirochaetota bacterium]HOU83260.1 diacylglycerol kinase [Spirochaetota bacterium]HPK55423.1 diacylglycerol kinase [Spirochaetota bacterium]HQE57603.1 diacylglycerol kinase [Spirochaetota bacterium]